ncbi:LacI family DNA-binding transcriptional regulator [Maribacter sp. HTCC2170]|uniref:LacI family DNA-binding transcriptional regulator n=1 Tax=Maribacter sp. (strain HTCC2170 / KCCM 42371) TaxID=313603 RepID=UPI00006B4992|nr:LacI family DNA-binding transcriptional regulator [Maribacter sp. HTCC2170]EAR00903.1 putative LacI-family transcriptional regulator [Maribacter sp. HTCC2170]
MGKKVTIYDLAEELQVSPGTVSRSLNNHPAISNKTKQRVISKASELGYKVNKFAVNLSKQKSNAIGVIVPRLNSYFMSTVLAGMEKVANEAGYNLIISQSLESMEKERLNTKTLYDSGVDGLLVSLARDTTGYDHFSPFSQSELPLIFFDRVHEMPNSSTIVIDNISAGFEATEHLITQGCKHILHISGNLNRSVYADRFEGFRNALLAHGLGFKEEQLLEINLDSKKVEDVLAHIKSTQKPIDGVFVASDTFAAHCIKGLQKEKYRIPEDIKVIGFNNDPISELVTPTLSTIDYPGYEMGVLAGQSIISHLNGNINLQSANSISLRHRLIVRESTK